MPNKLAHFAIEADDLDRAKTFYETVFGWTFNPWGPPGFYQIAGAGVNGALQERREPVPEGRKGMDLTFAVDELEATTELVVANGGQINSQVFTIPTVGRLVEVLDTEGNLVLVMQYEADHLQSMNLR